MNVLTINSATEVKQGQKFGEMTLAISECGEYVYCYNYTFCDTPASDICLLDYKNSDLLDTYADRKDLSFYQAIESVIEAMDDTSEVYKVVSNISDSPEYYYSLKGNANLLFIEQLRKLVGEEINDKAPKVVTATKKVGKKTEAVELKFVITDDYTAISEDGYVYQIVKDEADLATGVFLVYETECGLYFNYAEDSKIQDHTDDAYKTAFAMAFMEKISYERIKYLNADFIDDLGEAIDGCGVFGVTFFDDEVDSYFDIFVNDDFAWYSIHVK
jgi:hypothetical protein